VETLELKILLGYLLYLRWFGSTSKEHALVAIELKRNGFKNKLNFFEPLKLSPKHQKKRGMKLSVAFTK